MTEKQSKQKFLKYLIIALVAIFALIILAKTGIFDSVFKTLTGYETEESAEATASGDKNGNTASLPPETAVPPPSPGNSEKAETEPAPESTESRDPQTSEPDITTEKPATTEKQNTPATTEEQPLLDENGQYNSKEDVGLYIHLYGHLPSNYVTKTEARAKGWEGGGLDAYFPGCSIGGDKFGNNEGLLPKKKGRQYYECDIDTAGKSSRGAKRIVYSNDGLVYYTDDHYETFELLYGTP